MRFDLVNNTPFLFRNFDKMFDFETLNYFVDEDTSSWTLHMDLPGVDKKDLKIEIKDSVLVLTAESKEKRARKYNKSFSLPRGIDVDKIEADLKNGVLTVDMPKIEKMSKLIQIKD